MIALTPTRAVLGLAATTLVSLAAIAPAPASASCSKPIDPIGCVEGPVCAVGSKLGLQCVDSAAATPTESRVCISPLGLTPCLETIICGAPSKVARAAGLDEYGIDPTVNCLT